MADSIKKAKAGYEDLLFDLAGTGATTQVPRSDGNHRTVTKINASHIPATTTLRAKKYADGTTPSAAGDTDIDVVLQQVLDDLEDLGQPDGSTLENSSGTLQVADDGITATQIDDGAVGTDALAADAVTNAKLADNAVQLENMADNSVDTAELVALAVEAAKIATDAVTTTKIADANVTPAKLSWAPGFYPKVASTATLSGGAASEVHNDATVVATDIILATVKSTTGAVTLLSAAAGTGTVTFTFTGTIVANTDVYYTALRATA